MGSDDLSILCSRLLPLRKRGDKTGIGLPVYLEFSTGISSQFECAEVFPSKNKFSLQPISSVPLLSCAPAVLSIKIG